MVSAGELPVEGQRFGNTSLSVIVHDENGWRIKSFEPRSLADLSK
jgi:hypothetical protein